MDDTAAIDATHFEAKDQAPPKEEKPITEPKKRGRKSKEEREQWLVEKAELEASLPLFEKKIEDQLEVPLDELRAQIPQDPQWGVKKNSEGKNVFLYGYKAHLAVGTSSQYILQSLFSSGNLNDGKAAIPLLKGIHERLSLPSLRYETMDAGYDYDLFITRFTKWGIKLSLLIINAMSLNRLVLINISHLHVTVNIHIAMIVMTRNMKH
ncbi:hypothetical protein J2Y67_004388 [Neobacillus niacini]|nr:hypothetical protein [Neobacillus niacini]